MRALVAAFRSHGLTAAERLFALFVIALALGLLAIVTLDPYAAELVASMPDAVRRAARIITYFGEGFETIVPSAVIILIALWLRAVGQVAAVTAWLNRLVWNAGFVLMSVGGLGLIAWLIKNSIGRARPRSAQAGDVLSIRPLDFDSDFASLPSGHATTAGATVMVLSLLFPRHYPLFVAGGVAIAVSRVVLGVHYFSDVILGYTLGAVGTLAVALVLAHYGRVFRIAGHHLERDPAFHCLPGLSDLMLIRWKR